MATDTLEIFGTEYSGVTGIKATDSDNQTKTYIRPQGTIAISSSGNTDVTAYATASVASGTEGTPTATKGTVNNHSISVTPSVANSTGWITGSTKTGTAVTVSASELVSGSETKTQNGTYDVTTLAEIIVSVSGGGGSGLVYETGTYKPSSDTAKPTISFSNNHSELPIFAMMIDANGYTSVANSNVIWVYYNWERLIDGGVYTSSTALRYGEVRYSYRGTSASSITASIASISYPESNTGTSNSTYPRYSVTESGMYPYTSSTSRYWKANRTYKWIAVWNPTT